MKNKPKSLGMPVGSSSLLMIFIILCMTIFAVITFVVANNDYKLSQKTAENVTAFYVADKSAETVLAQVAHCIKNAVDEEAMKGRLEDYGLTLEEDLNSLKGSYSINIKEEIVLNVELEIFFDSRRYNVLSWRTVNNRVINDEEQYLNLLDF